MPPGSLFQQNSRQHVPWGAAGPAWLPRRSVTTCPGTERCTRSGAPGITHLSSSPGYPQYKICLGNLLVAAVKNPICVHVSAVRTHQKLLFSIQLSHSSPFYQTLWIQANVALKGLSQIISAGSTQHLHFWVCNRLQFQIMHLPQGFGKARICFAEHQETQRQ